MEGVTLNRDTVEDLCVWVYVTERTKRRKIELVSVSFIKKLPK